jgi:hypothetical protein
MNIIFGAFPGQGVDRPSSPGDDIMTILPNGIYKYYARRYVTDVSCGLWSLEKDIFVAIPVGEHLEKYYQNRRPSYGMNPNFEIGMAEFNIGNYLCCNFFDHVGWGKE